MVGLIFRLLCILVLFAGCKDSTQRGMELFAEGDLESAIPLLEDSCLEGSLKSCLLTASGYAKQTSKESKAKALKALNQACKYGDFASCKIVFKAYENSGLSTQALEALQNGCQGGEASLCYELARKYFQGQWVQKNEAKALELLVKSCYGGFKQGCKVAIKLYEKQDPQSYQIEKLQAYL